MSVELIAISSFVVAILGGLAHCVNKSNLKSCKMCCIDSDCRDENKATEDKMKELYDRIERNEAKITKNKSKLEKLKQKKRLSNIPDSPLSESSLSVESNLSKISHYEEKASEADANEAVETEI